MINVIRDQLTRNHVKFLEGTAAFTGPNEMSIATSGQALRVTAEKIVLAVGTRPARPDSVEFDDLKWVGA